MLTVAEVVAFLRSFGHHPLGSGGYNTSLSAVASLLESEHAARVAAERERDELRNRPCPYVHSSGEGTHYCTLPHAAEKELAELRKRIDEAPRGMVRGFMLEPETQPGWLDKMGGKHVAIVPLREGE